MLTGFQENWQPWKQRKGKIESRLRSRIFHATSILTLRASTLMRRPYPFDSQITAPLPLEAMYYLIKERASYKYLPDNNEYYNLIGESTRHPGTLVLATKGFFRDKPNGIVSGSLTDDTLAFLSLVMTYAKTIANNPLKKDESVKLRSVFMPRTDFTTLYNKVKSQLPGDLWNIIDTISC